MDIISLIKAYVTGLLDAEDQFIEHLNTFPELEAKVVELTNKMAADFLSVVLTTADEMIRNSGVRRKEYKVIRERTRTLISSVGDVAFTHTLYSDSEGHTRCLLDEQIRLPDHERLTTVAEARLLNEAEVHSYQHAADSISSGGQTISKTTVMNKVHAIEEELPHFESVPEEKKQVKYLYIEADEDHIHSQKDGKETRGCFIGKLIYLFEGKEEISKGRRKLINRFYFGGMYNGTDRNAALWKSVETYIRDHYDQDYLKRVYISGDGGAWIKACTNYVYKSRFVADRFHLMKYINSVARYTLDNEAETKERFYKYIYKNKLLAAKKLLTRIQNHCEGSDKAVENCRNFLINNWSAIQTAFHDKHVIGCSAEGHVSNVYSERMSSRPMGWSEIGGDRMCKLRCFVNNYGRDKVVDLVKYRRERALQLVSATGTDGIIDVPAKKHYTQKQQQARSYIERIQATLGMNSTIRKTLAIREQINSI